jgi:hypothetical protein
MSAERLDQNQIDAIYTVLRLGASIYFPDFGVIEGRTHPEDLRLVV